VSIWAAAREDLNTKDTKSTKDREVEERRVKRGRQRLKIAADSRGWTRMFLRLFSGAGVCVVDEGSEFVVVEEAFGEFAVEGDERFGGDGFCPFWSLKWVR
jgi:hypothetical protein